MPDLSFLEEREELTPAQKRERQLSAELRRHIPKRHLGDGDDLVRATEAAKTVEQEQRDLLAEKKLREKRAKRRKISARYRRRHLLEVRRRDREAKRRLRPVKYDYGPPPRPVESHLGEVWPSAARAAIEVGHGHEDRVLQAIADPTRVAGGRRWKYADQPRPPEWDRPPRVTCSRAVVTSDLEYFDRVQDAAIVLGCKYETVTAAITRGKPFRGRERIYFADDPNVADLVVAVKSAAYPLVQAGAAA